MDSSIKSFKGYGKVDEIEEQAFKKKTRKRLIIVIISSIVLLALVIGVVAGTIIHKRNSSSSPSSNTVPATEVTPAASLKAVCSVTQYPNSCFSSISSLETANTTDPEVLFKLSLHVAINELSKLAKDTPSKLTALTNDPKVKAALTVCQGLFEDAVDRLNDSISSMDVGSDDKLLSSAKINDIKTWLSTTITDQETCLDSLQDLNSTVVDYMKIATKNSTEFTSNSLAIVAKILGVLADFNLPIHRRLLGFEESEGSDEFPTWVSHSDRRLLQEINLTVNVTVAKDGSGDYTSISKAVEAVPKKSETRFVIHVKEGKYVENVVMDKSKWNVMMYGDGKDKTIISGSLNFVDGTPTFSTATFAVAGKGFIARDMGFVNDAGAAKHQAVAMRSGSDLSVFYRPWKAYSTTVIMQSEIGSFLNPLGWISWVTNVDPPSTIYYAEYLNTGPGSTVDKRVKWAGYKPTLVVDDAAKFTVESFIQGSEWLPDTDSEIGSFLNPLGWISWVTNVDPPSTIYYAEYLNTGPGSTVDKRVKWAGYKPTLVVDDAAKFTVESFIQGSEWLPDTDVKYDESL
ncbi:pectinesterase 3 [Quercus suber]|uniref:Pectinesterase n=1 Tax=Quercus suber TaxID=58331 RepID=A0AAW0L2X6_QUESU